MIKEVLNNKITWVALIFFYSIAFELCAQNHKGIDSFSLDGQWDIIFDDHNEGMEGQWYMDKNFENHTGKRKIEVPSCWEEFEKDYEGVAIYRKKFTIPEAWDGKIMELRFEASNYMTQVWLNDQVVGFHEGGYTPFGFRIDKLAEPGKVNTLTVRVIGPIILTDKRIDGLGRQEVPMWRGAIAGGIWQSVGILATGSQRLSDVFIKPDIHTNAAAFTIEIENTETKISESEIHIRILSATGELVAAVSDKIQVQPGHTLFKKALDILRAQYWSMDNPYLYEADIEIISDEKTSDRWSAKFGMREFTAEDGKFMLNGKPIYLKACFFEGLHPVKLAYPDSREMAIKEIMLAKEAGFNMIRPWRKPAPGMWLDLCDSLGMLTVGSPAVECMGRPVSTPRLPFMVENEIRKTILSNRNRTSIVKWELFNEITRPILTQMLHSMSILARDLDPTRMILDESGGWGKGANIYLPYQYTPVAFNDIHHYSGSQVHEQEYNRYLAIGKTEEEIRKSGLGNVSALGRNVVPGAMSFVSELGYGSTPDLGMNNERFQEEGNPIVAPTMYHRKMAEELAYAMERSGFNKLYPNLQDFYLEQQKMHGIANKRMIEATRSNSGVAGYCLHALVGGNWVIGAGLLDLWRNPKTLAYDMTKAANQPQIVAIRILPRNVYADRGAKLEITGINEFETREAVNISIEITGESGETIVTESLNMDFVHGVSTLYSDSLITDYLEGNYTVTVNVSTREGAVITSNSQPFDVFTKKQLATPEVQFAVVDPANSLVSFLQRENTRYEEFSADLSKDIPVIVGRSNKNCPEYMGLIAPLRQFAEEGGYVIFLDVPGINVPGFNRVLHEVEANDLPLGAQLLSRWQTLGSWAAKSHIVTDHPVFNGLPVDMIMHGVYENVHPKTTMAKQQGDYIAGVIGYDHFPNQDVMLRHFIGPGETWWAANVLEAEIGSGTMLLSTLDILTHLGTDPVAEKILYNIIKFAEHKNLNR